jgi:ribosome-binding protein aMBF1 (putative translation factor)
MKIEGRMKPPRGKKDRYWGVEIPLLSIFTQGRNRKDAYAMAADAVEALVGRKGFKAHCTPGPRNTFTVSASDTAAFVAFVLVRLRETYGLTVRDMAKRLHSSSPNSYARYEQGKAVPTVEKLEQLLRAIDPKLEPVLRAG